MAIRRRYLAAFLSMVVLVVCSSACAGLPQSDDNQAKNASGTDAASVLSDTGQSAPGYQVGEMPPVPLFTLPDLSLLYASSDAFVVKFAAMNNTYPGLTVSPAKADSSGRRVTADGAILAYEGGSSRFSDPTKTITINDNGSGRYSDANRTITNNGDGSGRYSDSNHTITVNKDGSGRYSTSNVTITLNGDGSGRYSDSGTTITVNKDGSGRYSTSSVTITNNGDGSGRYSDASLTITNDGKGTAHISSSSGSLDVAADPLPPVPALGKFPLLSALEPQNYCGVLITLDSALLFDYDKYEIRPEAREMIATVARALKDHSVPSATVEGHTDSMGDDAYNQTLSEKRAQAVLDLLRSEGVGTQMNSVGYGESQPIAPNTMTDGKDNPGGRQLNRRVEIYIPVF